MNSIMDSDQESGIDSDQESEMDSNQESEMDSDQESVMDSDQESEMDSDQECTESENLDIKGNVKSKKIKEEKPSFTHKPISNDVLEGKTLFFRNLSFELSEDDLKEKLSQFGDIKYIAFCKDKTTNRFKGTAFVQFMSKESAGTCLEASTDPAFKEVFKCGLRTFYVSPAMGRDDVAKKVKEKKKDTEQKDKRNIYLAREGVIREGTKPAEGLSKSDLALRVQREIMKRKMLSNLNTFVSPVRLFICNLPTYLTDKELMKIFTNNSSKGSVITECKVMRNLYQLDKEGNPISKGHAFVSFSHHQHALEALRKVNNNPKIFTPYKRPIVEFSLENKGALKAKDMRHNKSKTNNMKRKFSETFEPPEEATKGRAVNSTFMGSTYDPNKKGKKALHSHIGPKVRHKDKKGGAKITRNQINNKFRNNRTNRKRPQGSKVKKSNNKTKGKKKVPKSKDSTTTKQKSKKRKTFL